jgi:hypothetical protein
LGGHKWGILKWPSGVSGRKVKEAGEGYHLRGPSVPYKVNFDVENDDIGPENRHFWNIIID